MDKQFLRMLLLSGVLAIAACGGSSGGGPANGDDNGTGGGGGDNGDGNDDGNNAAPPATGGSKGLVFIAQTPNPHGSSDIGTHTATFGNSTPGISAAPRGGSLMYLRRDGELVDLLDEALKNGCDAGGDAICNPSGVLEVNDDGLLVDGYVARRPRIHWNADKLIFAMTRGAKDSQHGDIKPAAPRWQLYEIEGLDPGDTPLLTRVANQPDYNNVDPVYGSDGYIFFISDQPVTGDAKHYPQLDEYESLPINTGLWRLDTNSGAIMLMDHSPSGDFGPEITPDGHVLFTRWDHLQQDQQSIDNSVAGVITDREDFWEAYTYASEDQLGSADYTLVSEHTRARLQAWVDGGKTDALLHAAADGMEMYPETVRGNPFYDWDGNEGNPAGVFVDKDGVEHQIVYTIPATEFGQHNPLRFNHFLPWQIRQDGLLCETYRHTGLHENGGFIRRALRDDPKIADVQTTRVRIPDGFFLNQVHEDTNTAREIVTGVVAPEFGTNKAGRILQFVDTQTANRPQLHENGDAVDYVFLTDPENDNRLYRDPLFLSDGRLVAAVSNPVAADDSGNTRHFGAFDFTLYVLEKSGDYYEPAQRVLADGVTREFDFWEENGGLPLNEFSGRLWEIEMQEVVPRAEPGVPALPSLEAPELESFTAAGVDPAAFREFLENNALAAIVIRNATSRDEADTTQPFNLVVELPDGSQHEQTVRTDFQTGSDRLYPITYLQMMRGDYLRGYLKFADLDAGNFIADGGRRILPTPLQMNGKLAHNLDVAGPAPVGAVPVAEDGSIAALVPAHRAMTWQTTDNDGDPVVRERYWLTFQPGEVRVCASCHGVNDKGQDGNGKPQNSPLALQRLLEQLKANGEL